MSVKWLISLHSELFSKTSTKKALYKIKTCHATRANWLHNQVQSEDVQMKIQHYNLATKFLFEMVDYPAGPVPQGCRSRVQIAMLTRANLQVINLSVDRKNMLGEHKPTLLDSASALFFALDNWPSRQAMCASLVCRSCSIFCHFRSSSSQLSIRDWFSCFSDAWADLSSSTFLFCLSSAYNRKLLNAIIKYRSSVVLLPAQAFHLFTLSCPISLE